MTLPALVHEATLFALRIPRDPQLSPDGSRIAYTELRPERELDGYRRRVRVVGSEDGALLVDRDVLGRLPRWSPDGARLAFAAPSGLHLWGVDASEPSCLVADLEISQLAWRPDGGALAVVAAAPARPRPLDPIVVREVNHRIDGHAIPVRRQRLLIVELDGSARVVVDADFDVWTVAWSPDGTTIALAGGTHPGVPSRAYLWSAAEGLRPVTPAAGECASATWTPDGGALVCSGRREATSLVQPELLHVDLASGAIRQLAADLDRGAALDDDLWPGMTPVVTDDGRHVLFAANDRGCATIFRAPLDGGPGERIVAGPTWVVRGASHAGGRLAAVLARWDSPGDLLIAAADGSGQRWLTDLNAGLLDDVAIEPQSRTFTAPDGTEVHGHLTRPRGASGPTPLLLAIHGGPHGCFNAGFWDVEELQWLEFVARGWSVLALNARGSDGYGNACYGGTGDAGWGVEDGQDHLAAVEALVAEGVADPARVGVTGYSYGGYMTCWLLSQSDRFVAGAAGAAPTDMVGMYAFAVPGLGLFKHEFGGGPCGRWELYDRSSPLRHAERIATPLLLLHGAEDQQVPVAQPEMLFTTLRELGRATELVLYPQADHAFIGTGSLAHRLDYFRRTVAWIDNC